MKQFKYLLLAMLSTFVFVSCQNSKNEQDDTEINGTPEAFQEHSAFKDVSTISKSRAYQSLTDKLYNELKEKDNELKEIEQAIDDIRTKPKTAYENLTKYYIFLDNNSKYYNELKPFFNDTIVNIKSYNSNIEDSTLREQMNKLVIESEEKYILKIENSERLTKLLEKKTVELNDYKTALKITLTLKSIENYQNNFKQDTVSINELIKRYDTLTNKIKEKISK